MTLPADPSAPDGLGEALIAAFSARLLAGSSATTVLEGWCAERGFSESAVTAERMPGPGKPPDAVQRERLNLVAGETVRHRRVRLVCGGHILSVADNWYVPARLTPAMNRALEATCVPFGRVVHDLVPTRRTLGLLPLRSGSTPIGLEEPLFAVKALLATPDGVPFCEVDETYFGAVLGRIG